MRFNKTLLLFSFFFFSIIILHYTTPFPPTASTTISHGSFFNTSLQVGLLNKIMNLIGPQDYLSLLMTSIKGRINHMHKGNCDKTKWDFRLISKGEC
ncbi:hypothetical protein MtrunA17_Chr7g0264991 [Medicago truncatula]|uniref:Transmembrane protein, putative n=1 Tax=Medicago truncatula TaxID=3880 RepID=A0A072U3W1_MEDTR|nr:transmembrane protein, putative [Medicago truncatula]RHN48551.1 hypothetical protein MtrunA17_Chr7g0264991 [Medicago truncatula]